jgi:centrin-3
LPKQRPEATKAAMAHEQRDEINEAVRSHSVPSPHSLKKLTSPSKPSASTSPNPTSSPFSPNTASRTPPKPLNPNPNPNRNPKPKTVPVPPSRLYISLPAFQSIASNLIAAREPRDEILRAFRLYDTEGKGMITLEDLRRVARELNNGLEDDELVAMIEEFDFGDTQCACRSISRSRFLSRSRSLSTSICLSIYPFTSLFISLYLPFSSTS